MNDQHDSWDSLSRQWQVDDAAPAPDLRARIAADYRRANVRLWGTVALEVGVVVAVVLWTVDRVGRALDASGIVSLLLAWTVVVVAVGFSVRNRRGVWRADGESTVEYLAVCERRAESKLRTATFVVRFVLLLSAASLALALWQAWSLAAWSMLPSSGVVIGAILALYLGWAIWFRGRATRELAEVRQLREQLLAEPDANDL